MWTLSVRAMKADSQVVGSVAIPISWPEVDWDIYNLWGPTAAPATTPDTFVIRTGGQYTVKGQILYSPSSELCNVDAQLYVNGAFRGLARTSSAPKGSQTIVPFDWDVRLGDGDRVQIRAAHDAAASLSVGGGIVDNWVSIRSR